MAEKSEETVEDNVRPEPVPAKNESNRTKRNDQFKKTSSTRNSHDSRYYYYQRDRDRHYNYRSTHQRYYPPSRNEYRKYTRKQKKTDQIEITKDTKTDRATEEASDNVTIPVDDTENKKQSKNSPRPHTRKRTTPNVTPSAQSNELCQQLLGGVYECMVCCERLKAHQEVWSCLCCYHIFHLRCISRWAQSPAATAVEDHPEKGWRCPSCQSISTTIPSLYKCFCGRVTNPDKYRRRGDMTVPHSCGEPCRKKLGLFPESLCTHRCPQLCHPGPCPPCPVMVMKSCPCGKLRSSVRCSQFDGTLPSCNKTCNKLLDCGKHKCTDICHQGTCKSCTVPVRLKCYCTRETKEIPCGQVCGRINYSCSRLCNKTINCGNHTCESVCHPGECPPCSLLPSAVSYCPCGATPIEKLLPHGTIRTSCLDDVPCCTNKCLKPLPCSAYSEGADNHLCQSNCHTGNCPPCTMSSIAMCKCGKTRDKVPCSDVSLREGFTCNKNCGKKLSCGRHRCQKTCCVSDTHVCQRVCGKKHDCGSHICQDVCHSGKCGPCWNISYDELTCHCGGEAILPPIPCGTAPPTCTRPCARVHPCNHPVMHTCHSDDTCPPCTFLTDKMCMGGHTERNYIPCHIKDVSCGKPCGKPLPCGMHNCIRICHKGDCQSVSDVCRQPCTLERKYCSHSCSAPCHVGKPCPDQPCKAKVVLECSCGRRKEEVVCLMSGSNITSQTFHKMYSSELGTIMRNIHGGQSIKLDSLVMKTKPTVQSLACDEVCAQTERNRVLAEALELTDVDHSPDTPPQYSVFLLEQVRENPSLVSSIETVFKEIIEAFNGSRMGNTTHSFKPMKRNQRRIIHELAEYYHLSSKSYDPEPHRNVVVMATKKSLIPYVTLTESVKQKIVPLPISLKSESNEDYYY